MSRKICACGCRRPVTSKRKTAKWATAACVPSAERSAWGRKGRRNFAFRHRRKLFDKVLADVTRDGRRMTKESLLDAFMAIHRAAYQTGYHTAESKWKGRRWPTRGTDDAAKGEAQSNG